MEGEERKKQKLWKIKRRNCRKPEKKERKSKK